MVIRFSLWCLIFLTGSPGLYAQIEHDGRFELTISQSLTMGEVVQAAMFRSPDNIIINSMENYSSALFGRASSLFADTPEISIRHQNDNWISNQGLREWETSLDMPLWMPGQKSASKLKARVSERETAAYQQLAALEVTGQVRELLWELRLASVVLEESRNHLAMAEALNIDIMKRIAAGNLPRRNALLSSQEIMTRKVELIDAEAEYIHVAKRYESVTGLNEMPGNIDETLFHIDGNGTQEMDIETVPIIELANAKVDFVQAEFKETKNSWSKPPTLSFGVKRESGSFMDRNIDSVSLGLSVPLGPGVHTTSKRATAALTVAEAERERELIKRDYRLQLHEGEHELEICDIQLPFMQSHFELSQENLRLSQKAFDLGESDLLDLLKAREQYFISSSQNNRKIIECKRAVARHNQVRGVMLP